jgi:regulator of sigma E protease
MILQLAVIILLLSILVILHELGHFLAAKLTKVRVEEFGLGYPPLAKKLFTWKGTLFTLNWIPFGGFVKLEGEMGEEAVDESTTKSKPEIKDGLEGPFYTKSASARLFVILAGAATNLLVGIIAFTIVFSVSGIPLLEARISQIAPNSPAAQANIPINVNVIELKFANQTISTLTTQEVITAVSEHRGEEVTIVTTGSCQQLNCDDARQEFTAKIRTAAETPANEGALGITFNSTIFFPWYEMPWRAGWYGILQTIALIQLTLFSLGQMIANLVVHRVVPADVTGPVGIVYQTYKMNVVKEGLLSILNYSGLISVSLAIMNVLPIPALDGGRAVFILLEKVIGKSRSMKLESVVTYGGYIFLLALIILVTIRDIANIIKG